MLGTKLNIFGLLLFFVNKNTDCMAIKKIITSFNTFIINRFLSMNKDWIEIVNMLQQSGYQGQTEEEIVDRWFQTLCRTIGNEQGIDVTGSGYVQINRRDDGKTEVS